MLKKRTQISLHIAVFLTGLVGVVNLLSSVTPALPDRLQILQQIFPFEIITSGHLFAAISGFLLLSLATNLSRRKRVAWFLTIVLLIISIVSHLVKGLDYPESLLAMVLLAQLLIMQSVFTARSDPPSVAQGIRVFMGALLFTLIYGTSGFFFLDKHYSVNFSFGSALTQTLAMFLTENNADLIPMTRFGRFFADSIYTIGTVTLGYSVLMLLRPVFFRSGATSEERQRAQTIIETQGHSALARFALFDDKFYFFSPSGQSVIAYVPKGRAAIALGDPIGPESDRQETILTFQEFCRRNDWYPAFYQTSPQYLFLYQQLGMQALQIGEEAIVDLQSFSLEGKAGKNTRPVLNKFKKLGHHVEFYEPPIASALMRDLKTVSDEWLQMMNGSEKQFSLGWFNEAYLQGSHIALIRQPDGVISAFANVITEYQDDEVTIDLMRRRQDIENGTMDFLFISLFQEFKAQGYGGFNLGLSALAGVGKTQNSPKIEKVLFYLYQHLNHFYNFQGLHAYKDKFRPRWEPRYLIYPNMIALPDVVVGLIRADSGDRLLDYFKLGN